MRAPPNPNDRTRSLSGVRSRLGRGGTGAVTRNDLGLHPATRDTTRSSQSERVRNKGLVIGVESDAIPKRTK